MYRWTVYGYDQFGSTHPCYVSADSEEEAIQIAKKRYNYTGRIAICE